MWEHKERKVTNDSVWNFYNKRPNYTAECKFCTKIFSYASFAHFQGHLRTLNHTINMQPILKKKLTETPVIYFDQIHSKCSICNTVVPYHNFGNHVLTLHNEEDKRLISHENKVNAKEYWQPISDFTGKCKLCENSKEYELFVPEILDYHTFFCHMKEYNDYNIALSGPTVITSEEQLWQFYTKLKLNDNFQAKCNQCNFQSDYIKTANFIEHVKEIHPEIKSYEEQNRNDWPWMYFKYHEKYTSECLLCLNTRSLYVRLPSKLEYLKIHLNYQHTPQTIDHERYNCNWVWKYLKKSDNNEIKCNHFDCPFKMPVEFIGLSLFDEHIKTVHSNIMSRSCDVGESSGSQPKRRKTDDSSKD